MRSWAAVLLCTKRADLQLNIGYVLRMAQKTLFSMKHSSEQKLLITTGFKVCNISVQMVFAIYGSIFWIVTNKPSIKCSFNDQYRQNLLWFIKTSSRFRVLSSLKDGVEMSPYITQIRNPDIRQIFTRLRIDLNCLVKCKNKEDPRPERYLCFLSYWRRECRKFFTGLHSFW